MKKFVFILSISFLFFSCKDDSNPIKTEPPNPYVQTEIDWPSLKKTPWPKYRHDAQLTGRTKHSGPSLLRISDSIAVGYDISSIIIDIDSTFFVSTTFPTNLSKWKYNSKKMWEKDFGVRKDTYNPPILTSYNFLYYITPNRIYRINNDTIVQWHYDVSESIFNFGSSIDKEGNLYVTSYTGKLYVVSPSGTLLWSLQLPYLTSFSSVFSPDGSTLYVQGASLFAVDIATRQIKWRAGKGGIGASPMVDMHGNVYFFSSDSVNDAVKAFYCLTPRGTVRWKSEGAPFTGPGGDPTIDWDGNIYYATDTVYSYTNDGALRWKLALEPGEQNSTSLLCDGKNTIYVLTTKKNIYAVQSNGVIKWKFKVPLQSLFGHSPSIADGKMFVPTAYDQKILIIE
ncbi:MAG: PQQ-binding-like beta-propeller repeat protein [Bacteroidota bacterium]